MAHPKVRRSFKGHLGHLTPEQEQALETFKEILGNAGLYTPATETSRASHDDATLARFLRARRFDPIKAEKQFADRLSWEKKHDVHDLFANFPTDEFENSRRYYPRWTGRRDRQGLPLYVYKLSALSDNIQEEIHSVPPQRRYERIVVLYEVMTRFVAPLCTYLPHEIEPTPVSAVTAIIDLGNVSMRQMWALRNHLQEASELANANYPETLGTVVVVNAPGFFSTIWSWVKAWFDENTRDKIHILGHLNKPDSASSKEITSLIDPVNLPLCYGGQLGWDFFDEPNLDDAACQVIGEVPKGPWIFDNGKVQRPKEYKGDDLEFRPRTNGATNGVVRGSGETEVSSLPIPNGNTKVDVISVDSHEVGVVIS
ncbi:hypothetical protein ACEPAH_8778 [Sanghuangporus vaninii]